MDESTDAKRESRKDVRGAVRGANNRKTDRESFESVHAGDAERDGGSLTPPAVAKVRRSERGRASARSPEGALRLDWRVQVGEGG